MSWEREWDIKITCLWKPKYWLGSCDLPTDATFISFLPMGRILRKKKVQHRFNLVLNNFAVVDIINSQSTKNNWSFALVFKYPAVPPLLLKTLIYFASLNKNSQINISTSVKSFWWSTLFPFIFYIYCIHNMHFVKNWKRGWNITTPPPLFFFFGTFNISFLLEIHILGRNSSDLVMFDIVIWQFHTNSCIWVWLSNFRSPFLPNAFALLVTGALLCHSK